MSFIDERVSTTGLTFDDVLLVPAYSEVLPREVSTVGRFSEGSVWNGVAIAISCGIGGYSFPGKPCSWARMMQTMER